MKFRYKLLELFFHKQRVRRTSRDMVHQLDITTTGPIRSLLEESGLKVGLGSDITDTRFPCSEKGTRFVRFRIFNGRALDLFDGGSYMDICAKFLGEKMRCVNPAEALLPFAKNQKLGRRRPVVMFFKNSCSAFVVWQHKNHRWVKYVNDGRRFDPAIFDFLGVVCDE